MFYSVSCVMPYSTAPPLLNVVKSLFSLIYSLSVNPAALPLPLTSPLISVRLGYIGWHLSPFSSKHTQAYSTYTMILVALPPFLQK